ncbi:MAG: hypothetical protein LBH51_03250 [Treponema sp.]|jgi:uncharacterized protein (DUF608 family)|nr:hypothetical protein [Treponema sp.]
MTKARRYANDAVFAAFPLGGIGTGAISLGSRGDLRDFEIFNHPDKGNKLPFSFFAIRAELGPRIDVRVLEARMPPDFNQPRGYHPSRMAGMPRFKRSVLSAAYPLARLEFEDDTFPLEVSLEAFNPCIPLRADDSGIPAILFRYRVRNPGREGAKVAVAATMPNISAYRGFDCFDNYLVQPGCRNTLRTGEEVRGIFMDGDSLPKTHLRYADNAILTRERPISAKTEWRRTGWWDGLYDFWDDFRDSGILHPGAQGRQDNRIAPAGAVVGSLAVHKELPPGGEADFEFALSWYVPNRVKGWPPYEDDEAEPLIRNHYALRFADSWEAGRFLLANLDELEGSSRAFSDAVYDSTVPEPVIDAVMSNITALRSTTCFRIEDGTFLAWEGSHEHAGSCMGTCTHVWNYAQTAAYLFPELERTARRNEFLRETDGTGKMAFRTNRIFGRPEFDMLAAADGQLGTIVRAYREWSLGAGKDFLAELWPRIKAAFAYTRTEWDPDGDELLEGRQHNTYDIEFYGVNPLTGVLYLAALEAMERMARAMGEEDSAASYRERRERSAKLLDERTYNGEYYIQLEGRPGLPPGENPEGNPDDHPYQFGRGCLSDQLFGQTLAYMAGLGRLLPEAHTKSAARSVFTHNFKTGPQRGPCLQRLYVADDEAGLVLASWPRGGKPKLPFVYADEVWTGVEYQTATLLICEGFIDEALAIVENLRSRQDGYRRNPWNEAECGFHYARSLASWGLLPALTGERRDPLSGAFSFEPRVNKDDFRCFFSDGSRWGILRQRRDGDGNLRQTQEILGRAGN